MSTFMGTLMTQIAYDLLFLVSSQPVIPVSRHDWMAQHRYDFARLTTYDSAL